MQTQSDHELATSIARRDLALLVRCPQRLVEVDISACLGCWAYCRTQLSEAERPQVVCGKGREQRSLRGKLVLATRSRGKTERRARRRRTRLNVASAKQVD